MSQTNLSSISTVDLSEEEKRFLVEKNLLSRTDWVYTNPCHILFPPIYKHLKEAIKRFEFRPKDVFALAYPKSGTTWMSEILWAMASIDELHRAEEEAIQDRIHHLHNDLVRPVKENEDIVAARKFRAKFPGKDFKDGVWIHLAKIAPDRRVFKSHYLPPLLHSSFLEKAKVVYVLRSPKDACISFYYHHKNNAVISYPGDFSEFCDIYMSNVMPWGTYWNHVREMWALRNHPNIHFVFYEDLKKNLMRELRKLNQFCEFNLSEDQISRVAKHVDIEEMQRREKKIPIITTMTKPFIREGKVGGWAELASPELDARMDKWIKEGSKGIDIKFSYQ